MSNNIIITTNKLDKKELNNTYEFPILKYEEYFGGIDDIIRFVTAVESLVRTDKRYNLTKSFLLSIGMNKCAIMSNIEEDISEEDGKCRYLEMHHGPVFNLFDICFIVTYKHLVHKRPVSTFRIADEVLNLHLNHMVCLTMVSESIHTQEHNNPHQELKLTQCWGRQNLAKFVELYIDGMLPQHYDKLQYHIERILANPEKDKDIKDIYEISKNISQWRDLSANYYVYYDDNSN